ncbi:hypothetical protein T8K17_04040 [Thalassobaculum sp. OXR-137]|uniref:hypothetical protein n=1 Tax=Thalassobaculum sp. OXR-137 TaxID=3100173 RepID=UPI002AC8E995|nr:hypothetical protein [Thalassobaculum sp. OXR-137]WPZ35317.1 hypothetical protein T8K17_04040 [Thalassobaculum sp. OXR-137]
MTTLRLLLAVAAVVLACSLAWARSESAPLHGLRALAGQPSNTLVRTDVFRKVLERFLPTCVRSDILYPGATASGSVMEVLSLPGQALRLSGDDRFLTAESCRVHECSASKGVVVLDTETAALCAVIFHPFFRVDDNFDRLGNPLDRQVVSIEAEIFVPAADDGRPSLLARCADAFADAVHRAVSEGQSVRYSDIEIRTAPTFSSDRTLRSLFQPFGDRPPQR